MLDAMISIMDMTVFGPSMGIEDQSVAAWPGVVSSFQAQDGLFVLQVGRENQFERLAHAIGRTEWLEDPRFATAAGRVSNAGERLQLTQEVLRTRKSAEWLARLDAEGVPCAPVLAISEIPAHPQVVENGLVVTSEHPSAGPMRQPRAAALFGEAEGELAPAPTLGEHTDEVLGELGLGAGEIRQLRESGAVA